MFPRVFRPFIKMFIEKQPAHCYKLSMKKFLFIASALCFQFVSTFTYAKPPVVELFTSTLCPNCPMAEKYMAELEAKDDVFALNYHIDISSGKSYEPYATKANEARQYLYQKKQGQKYLYTPNVVSMGHASGNGAMPSAIDALIRKGGRIDETLGLGISHTENAGEIRVSFPEKKVSDKDIWMVTYDKIKRKKSHAGPSNIVRTVERIGVWKGKAANYRIAKFKPKSGEYIALLVQEPHSGDIVDYVTVKR